MKLLFAFGRECYQFMSSRPWQKVNDFYAEMVQGRVSLSHLFRKEVGFSQEFVFLIGLLKRRIVCF